MTRRVKGLAAAAVAAVIVLGATASWAQRTSSRTYQSQSYSGNVRYDGRFTFVRMSYPYSGRGDTPWAHDYPVGEANFLKILTTLSNLNAHTDASSIMSFSDPELFKFPVAYLVEPGYWYLAESEVVALRAYLQKGGFLIVDDFPNRSRGNIDSWGNFEVQMGRVFPEGKWVELDPTHPLFHSFYDINSFDTMPPAYNLGGRPMFMALFEDNNPKKRMLVVANYQNDLSEYWEASDTGYFIVDYRNEAFKYGINQFIYGITH
jgi:hypothetical protein